MSKLIFSELSEDNLLTVVNLAFKDFDVEKWHKMASKQCTKTEQEKITSIQEHLVNYQLNLMNEATIWARAIYPLLLLAERGNIQAWAEVSMHDFRALNWMVLWMACWEGVSQVR